LLQQPSQQHIAHPASSLISYNRLIALTIEPGKLNPGRAENHASRLMRKLIDNDLLLLTSFRDELFHWVLLPDSDSVCRNLLPLLSAYLSQECAVQPELVGKVYLKCFEWVDSEHYAIAVRCNAMQ